MKTRTDPPPSFIAMKARRFSETGPRLTREQVDALRPSDITWYDGIWQTISHVREHDGLPCRTYYRHVECRSANGLVLYSFPVGEQTHADRVVFVSDEVA